MTTYLAPVSDVAAANIGLQISLQNKELISCMTMIFHVNGLQYGRDGGRKHCKRNLVPTLENCWLIGLFFPFRGTQMVIIMYYM